VCLVAWPSNGDEAGGDLALIETSLLFLCKLALISMRTTSLTQEKRKHLHQRNVISSLTFIRGPGDWASSCKMVYYAIENAASQFSRVNCCVFTPNHKMVNGIDFLGLIYFVVPFA